MFVKSRVRSRHLLLILGLGLILIGLAIPACSLPQLQGTTAQASQTLQGAQVVSSATDTQIAQLKATLATMPTPQDVTDLKTQIATLQSQLQSAATQPGQSSQVQDLTQQVAALQAQLALAPAASTLANLQAQLSALQKSKAQADGVLASLTAAATQAAQGAQNASTAQQAIGSIMTAAAPASAAIPTWGWAVSLGLSLVGNYLLSKQSTTNKAAATSIASSVAVAAQAGQLSITPAGISTLNSIQTPAARAIIDQHQKDTGTASLGDMTQLKAAA